MMYEGESFVGVSWYTGVKAVLQRRFPRLEQLHVRQGDRSAAADINVMSARRGEKTVVFTGLNQNTFVRDASKAILTKLYS